MAIITLTTDWGEKDYYIGTVKGSILSLMPNVTIVDISHKINHFDIEPASFVIKNCYKSFPKGTIHIIGVNSEASIETPHVLICYQGYYFIGADNGIFSLIFDEKPEKIIEITIYQDSNYFTFPTQDIFIKVAHRIIQGDSLESIGIERDSLNQLIQLNPIVEANAIKGNVIYVDSYENVITNITEPIFKEIGKGKRFTISFRSGYEINTISHAYKDAESGEKLALFGSSGYLEIAINMGKASSLLGLKLKDSIRIDFD